MSTDVLLLSSLYDFSTDEIAHRLEQNGVRYLRLNREDLPMHELVFDPIGQEVVISGPIGDRVIDADLRSVFFRQPVFLRNTPPKPLLPEEQLEISQWMAFLRGLSTFKSAMWVNAPQATYLAESKPYQLHVATEIGFTVPRTIITNCAEEIRSRFPSQVVIKSVDSVLLRDGDHSLFAYTTVLSSNDIVDKSLRAAPVIAQEVLEPKIDLRVTVVGNSVFAVQILKDGHGISGDWRLTDKAHLEYVDWELSPALAEQCRSLVARLGLVFGAIDLAVTPNAIYFIEINPTGEWGWISSPQRPICAAIVDCLHRGDVDHDER